MPSAIGTLSAISRSPTLTSRFCSPSCARWHRSSASSTMGLRRPVGSGRLSRRNEGQVTLLYFAWVRQKVGLGEEICALPAGVRTISDLVLHLAARGGG